VETLRAQDKQITEQKENLAVLTTQMKTNEKTIVRVDLSWVRTDANFQNRSLMKGK